MSVPGALALTLVLVALFATPALADPPCAATCPKLAEERVLADGMSVERCTQTLCQEEGRQLYEQGDFEASLEAYDFILPELEGSPSLALDRGTTLYAMGRFEEALASFEVVQVSFPDSMRAGAQRAHTLDRLGRVDDALAQFRKLQELPSADAMYRDLRTPSYLAGNIGVLLLRKGKTAEGKAELERAVEIDGKNQLATSMLHRVVPYLESGDLDPEGLHVLQIAFEDLSLGRQDAAAAGLSRLVTQWPRYAPGYLILAEGLRNRAEYGSCEKALTVAQNHLPDNVEIRAQRIRCGLLLRGVTSPESKPLIAELKELDASNPHDPLIENILEAIDE